MDSELLSEREVFSEYRLKIAWMRRARRERRGPVFLKLGRKMVRYRRADIEAYLSANAIQTTEPGQ
jgi:predicted DNA-binding transcriptional regulator AlpA